VAGAAVGATNAVGASGKGVGVSVGGGVWVSVGGGWASVGGATALGEASVGEGDALGGGAVGTSSWVYVGCGVVVSITTATDVALGRDGTAGVLVGVGVMLEAPGWHLVEASATRPTRTSRRT
jgi:hypothetical protein